MGYASQSGHARTSVRRPQAHAICDFCGFRYNHCDLKVYKQWQGTSLVSLNFLVCSRCLDRPQQQLRAIIIPADPVPIRNPRTEPFVEDES